jgi:Family of unknown function (DUF5681)
MSKNPELPSHNDSTQSAAGGNDSSYRVGYGHPPKHSQFRPGQSGNPSGRPKRVKNLQAELLDELGELMIREGESELEISKARAIAKTLVDKAVGGNLRAIAAVVSFCGRSPSDADEQSEQEGPEDREIVDDFVSRELRRRAGNSSATDTQQSSETDNDKEQSNEP